MCIHLIRFSWFIILLFGRHKSSTADRIYRGFLSCRAAVGGFDSSASWESWQWQFQSPSSSPRIIHHHRWFTFPLPFFLICFKLIYLTSFPPLLIITLPPLLLFSRFLHSSPPFILGLFQSLLFCAPPAAWQVIWRTKWLPGCVYMYSMCVCVCLLRCV